MSLQARKGSQTFDKDIRAPALRQAVSKLDPRRMWRNPVMLVVEIGAVLTLRLTINPAFFGGAVATSGYNLLVTVMLVLTVWFANYAEPATLRKTRQETPARRLRPDGSVEMVTSSDLRRGDLVVVAANDVIPGDGDVVQGVAYVNEAAISR